MQRYYVVVFFVLFCALVKADPGNSQTGVFPPIISQSLPSFDSSGVVETFSLTAPTDTSQHPFFQSLGTNGRACATCHEPRSAWSVSATSIKRRFAISRGKDPIFRVNDGATCDTDDVSTLTAKLSAYSLLLSKGLIRISLPLPTTQLDSNPPLPPDFTITSVKDPYGCTSLSSGSPTISVYRRPLPAANLFLTQCPQSDPSCAPLSIMWDGREQSLESQATDATLGHAQAQSSPTDDQLAQIVNFESNVFDAQAFDFKAGLLSADGATGGPISFRSWIFSLASTTLSVQDLIQRSLPYSLHGKIWPPRITRMPRAHRLLVVKRSSIPRHLPSLMLTV